MWPLQKNYVSKVILSTVKTLLKIWTFKQPKTSWVIGQWRQSSYIKFLQFKTWHMYVGGFLLFSYSLQCLITKSTRTRYILRISLKFEFFKYWVGLWISGEAAQKIKVNKSYTLLIFWLFYLWKSIAPNTKKGWKTTFIFAILDTLRIHVR